MDNFTRDNMIEKKNYKTYHLEKSDVNAIGYSTLGATDAYIETPNYSHVEAHVLFFQ